jgi:RNA 2',3'-cyclic 3'-phosphodiesterase
MKNEMDRNASIRVFIAAAISDHARGKISDLLAGLKKSDAAVRWVKPSSIHLTLRFIGNIDPDRTDALFGAVMDCVKSVSPFETEIKGFGAFPNQKRPRVYWLGFAKGGKELRQIFDALEEKLETAGFGKSDKSFSPHLTLGRVKSGKGKERVLKALDSLAKKSFGRFTIDRICLYQSELRPEGAKYTVLKEAVFGGRP